MKKKWSDPLDRLLAAEEKAQSVNAYLNNKSDEDHDTEHINYYDAHNDTIEEVDTSKIQKWKYKDRPENELGNIEELADTFKSVGQQQPCILRPSKEQSNKYELIVGERRWRAAEIAGLKLKAIIKELDDKSAALIQAIENDKRNDISEYAKGMSYADKIDKGLITQSEIIETLGISKQQVTRLLSYKKIPEDLSNAIEDFRSVSSRTAYELSRLSNKSEQHLQALISMADKIREGKYGAKRIEKEVERRLTKMEDNLPSQRKITHDDGRHLFTWRLDNNYTPSIHFSKDIKNLLIENKISFEDLTNSLKECVTKNLIE